MTDIGTMPLRRPAAPASKPRKPSRSRLPASLATGCGVVGLVAGLAIGTSDRVGTPPPSRTQPPRSVAAAQPAPAAAKAVRVAATDHATHEGSKRGARARPAGRAAPVAAPTHLFTLPQLAEASRFETVEAERASRLDAAQRFIARAVETAEAAEARQPAIMPSEPERIAAATLASQAIEPLPGVTTAEEALEAALVPTPSRRPRDARPVAAGAPLLARRDRTLPSAALAYARPDAGDAQDDIAPPRAPFRVPQAGNGVAVYDISASTVYLPSGERLEAHSGLGAMRDNPRFVHKRNTGPTPPHTYDLTLRESLFHGVQAIRLTPLGGERKIFNRNGLLAHTYMLGPRGDSNGCVSFKNYKRFLAAFRRGEIRRLVVVSSSPNPVSRLASLFGGGGR